jgi:hypothetical protein
VEDCPEEERDGDAWGDAGADAVGACVEVVLSGTGVETLHAASPARLAMAAAARIFFKILLPVLRCGEACFALG